MKEFRNKKILITGATKGLGRVLAIEFSKLKSKLVLVARNKKLMTSLKKITEKNNKNKNLYYSLDLFDQKKMEIMNNDIKKKFKNIDIVIHCVGGSFGVNDNFESWDNFEKCLRGNIGIAIDINKFFIPDMIKRKSGNIIHVGSVVSDEIGASVPYISSKSTLTGYVRALGNYLANYNVKLSAILPGAFFGVENAMSRFKFYKPKEYSNFKKSLPMGKMPLAEDYLKLIKILCSEKANIFCGSVIPVDSGQGKSVNHRV
tara:strand:- start:224 stop:1000 length:777 start_codon:yes stop_codon:yes gene_type:complete